MERGVLCHVGVLPKQYRHPSFRKAATVGECWYLTRGRATGLQNVEVSGKSQSNIHVNARMHVSIAER